MVLEEGKGVPLIRGSNALGKQVLRRFLQGVGGGGYRLLGVCSNTCYRRFYARVALDDRLFGSCTVVLSFCSWSGGDVVMWLKESDDVYVEAVGLEPFVVRT